MRHVQALALAATLLGFTAWAQFQPPASASSSTAGPNFTFVDAGSMHVANDVSVGTTIDVPINGQIDFHDSNYNQYWDIGDMSSALGNIGALGFFRTGGTNPYFWLDPGTGYAVARFGMAVASANDGSGQRLVPVLGPNDAGVLPEACLHGNEVESSGSAAVTFNPAFSVAPDCVCNHRDVTNSNDCTVHAGPTTAGMTLAVASGGSDRVMWICCGPR